MIVLRFFIGFVESIFYPAAHYLIGSWYTPAELGKRACVFHASSAAAGMFSGYLQAAVYEGLNGTLGHAGWQWLFIMDGVISLPICFAGFWLYPDFPETTRAFFLNDSDKELAMKRMQKIGRKERTRLGWSVLRRVFGRWHVYALTVLYIIFINFGPSSSINPLSLWLKATGWSVAKIVGPRTSSSATFQLILVKQNIIPTGQYAVQLVLTVSLSVLSDFLRKRALVMSISTVSLFTLENTFQKKKIQKKNKITLPNTISKSAKYEKLIQSQFFGCLSSLLLAIWYIPTGVKWFSYFISRAAVPYGPLAMSWANEICGGDAEERALVLGIMNASGYAFNAW